MIFNGLWSLVFFGLKNPLLALIIILILWILIQRSIFWFRLIDRKSAIMLYPYLAWVSFATLLNTGIVYNNVQTGAKSQLGGEKKGLFKPLYQIGIAS